MHGWPSSFRMYYGAEFTTFAADDIVRERPFRSG